VAQDAGFQPAAPFVYNALVSSPNLSITAIGRRAHLLLAHSQSASVWGCTSQGLFLHLPPRAVIFLSFEDRRGPLTANLAGDGQSLEKVSQSEPVRIDSQRFTFLQTGAALDWHSALLWDAPPLPQVSVQLEEVLERCQEVQRLVTAQRNSSLNLSLRAKRSNLEEDMLLPALLSMLGQGFGLTPSGDDVVLGCLLALSRWGQLLSLDQNFQALSQELVSSAYVKTTLLSANLIECAADGQADERLLLALDGIFYGQPSEEQCANLLLSWGHSSGCEALLGMGMAILCLSG
jgi:hypothetical protein